MAATANDTARDTSTVLVDPHHGPDHEVDAVAVFHPVDLTHLLDGTARTEATDPAAGGLNVWGNTLPAGELPAPGSRVEVDGVPFVLAGGSSAGDNVSCRGQLLELEPRRVDWVHLLAASERRTEDELGVHFDDDHVDLEPVRVSDFWAAAPWFGEVEAFRTTTMHYPGHTQPGLAGSLWAQRVPVVRRRPVATLRLPRTIALHVFAVTLEVVRRPGAPAGGAA